MGGDQTVKRLARPSRRDHRVPSANCRFGEGLSEPARCACDEPYTRHARTHLSMPRIIAGKRHPVKINSASALSHLRSKALDKALAKCTVA
jgi:hypothetical protein